MKLVVEDLRKDYHRGSRRRGDGDKPALDGVSLAIEDGAFFTLLGPSGCGKTTLLRCIAGLEVPDSGEIRLGDRVLFSSASGTNIPPNRLGIGVAGGAQGGDEDLGRANLAGEAVDHVRRGAG